MARIKGSAKKKIVTPKSTQAVSVDVSDYKLNLLKKHPVTIICVFLTITICSVYLQVKDHQFINFDDYKYVTENSHVLSGLNLENIKWAFISVYATNWHPFTWISYMMDVDLFGMKPGMHHLTNVIFHILNSILLLIVLNQMTGALWRSAAVAALFALHPLHVESVAWIAERKDVLSTFFWMLTMLAYHRYVRSRTISKYLLMILFFGLGLMAKPMLVTLPFVLLLLDFWPLRREELNFTNNGSQIALSWWPKINPRGILRLILEKVPLMIMALAASGVTFYAQSAGGAIKPLERFSLGMRIQNAIISYVTYLWKMVWPLNLAVFYPYPKQFSILTVVMCFLLLIAISVIVVMSLRRLPYLVIGWFWYLGTLVPVIGIVQVGDQSMADRYTYIPLIGIFIMIAWGIPELLDKWQFKKIALATLTGIVIPILIVSSWIQVGYWKDSEILFRHALNVTDNNSVAHNNLGNYLLKEGDVAGAIGHLTQSLKINPNNTFGYNTLAKALYEENKYNEAITQLQKCLRINPQDSDAYNNLGNIMLATGNYNEAERNYMESLRIDPHQAHAYNNLGTLFKYKNNIKKAIEYYQVAIHEDPALIDALKNLEIARGKQKRLEEVLIRIKESVKADPQNPLLYTMLGNTNASLGEYDESIVQYQKALSIVPNYIQAMYGLALIYSNQQDYKRALDSLQNIRQLRPDNPLIYYNIACIYAKQNMTKECIGFLNQAIDKGFKDWDQIKKDPDLSNIRNTPYVTGLMTKHSG